LPGGGAEIFAPAIRKQICEDKIDGAGWLDIHKTAHQLGMHSNATMLYGHIEHYTDRIDHMNQLRLLQDETKGFNCFIPLKFRNQDNDMSHIPETTLIEDIKAYAIARIFLDNFAHVKAYWPMLGRNHAQLMLNFGVDDLDGTIDDSTKIYSMAGSEEQNPAMSTEQLCSLITDAKRIPVERDSIYNILRVYENEQV
jgi:aminodeoxyfutalosine synthase